MSVRRSAIGSRDGRPRGRPIDAWQAAAETADSLGDCVNSSGAQRSRRRFGGVEGEPIGKLATDVDRRKKVEIHQPGAPQLR